MQLNEPSVKDSRGIYYIIINRLNNASKIFKVLNRSNSENTRNFLYNRSIGLQL